MIGDPSLSIQDAIIEALLANPNVTALVNLRVFDKPKADATYPYISMGTSQALTEDAECIEGYEVFHRVDVWSQKPGYAEVKEIAGAVRKAIHRIDLPLSGFALVEIEHRTTDYIRDPNPLTSHAALEFRAMIESDDNSSGG